MAAEQTLSVSLGTVEQATVASPSFLAYWSRTLPRALSAEGRLTPDTAEAMRHISDFMVAASAQLSSCGGDGPDIKVLSKYEVRGEEKLVSTKEALSRWSYLQGGLNPLRGSEGLMLKAATLILKGNVSKRASGFKWSDDWHSSYRTFINLWDKNSVDEQKTNLYLFRAAQLVHKAAWLEPISERREQLFKIAGSMYDRTFNDRTLRIDSNWFSVPFSMDIAYHLLEWQLPRMDREESAEAVRQLLAKEADLLKRREVQAAGRPDKLGFVAEGIGALALRDMYLDAAVTRDRAVQFRVRHAFEHEDGAPSGVKPKAAFDLVVQKRNRNNEVIGVTPLQIKLDTSGRRSGKGEVRRYLSPPIVFGRLSLTPEMITEVVDGLVEKYASPQPVWHTRHSVDLPPALVDVRQKLSSLIAA